MLSSEPPGRGCVQMETETPDHPQSPCQHLLCGCASLGWDAWFTQSSQHKALQSRWCPRPRQVPPAFHVTMGVWPGRCPSHLFPGYCDLRSYPHLAAGAAVVEQPLLSPPSPCLCSRPAILPGRQEERQYGGVHYMHSVFMGHPSNMGEQSGEGCWTQKK